MTTERWSPDPSPPQQPAQQPASSPASSPVPADTQRDRLSSSSQPSSGGTQGFFGGSVSQESPSKVVATFEDAARQAGQGLGQAPGTPRNDRAEGRWLAHFRVDQRIASGGMGEVFLGFDTSLQRPVAIKTIRPELAADQGFLSRFLREATAQANVVHPSVVQVYYVGVDQPSGQQAGQQPTWFIAMQVVDGGSLYDVLKDKRTLRWQEAAEHMTGLVEGLCVAEERGIVHRDIKPANILVDQRGKALLADFGLAVAAGAKETPTKSPSSSSSAPAFAGTTNADTVTTETGPTSGVHGSQLQLMSLTQVGVVMGTPEYVAPEQLKIGAVDVRADIYALGATFYHLLAGTPVADVRTLPATIALYDGGHQAKPLRTLRRDVPKAFADVVDACVQVDKHQRPSSMKELLLLLRRAAPQPLVPASPLVRAVVWAADTAPFLAVTAASYEAAPWLGPLLFFVAGLIGMSVVGSSPGIWLMRLRLRTVDDSDVSVGRGFGRFMLQHGWYVPATIGLSALYASSGLDVVLVVGAAWLALSVLGSLGALFGAKQTLHDKLTGTRVLVDVR